MNETNKLFWAGVRLLYDIAVSTAIFLAITMIVLAGGKGLSALLGFFGADGFTQALLTWTKMFILVVDVVCYCWWVTVSAIHHAKSIRR